MQMQRWVALAILGATTLAYADDVSRADALFDEGKALMEKDLQAGCAKLEASLQLNPQAVGTLLNVALCDVRLGRLATAAEHFARARDMAREQGMKEHLEAAEAHLVVLEPRLPRVTFKLVEPVPDTKITIGDRLLSPAGWADVRLDPGEHRIVVSAPGRITFRSTLRLAEGERQDVMVPRLATATSARTTLGKATVATGAGLLATGIVVGIVSGRRYDRAREGCLVRGGVIFCDDRSYDDANSARSLGTVGTVVGVVGVVTAGVGAYLWLRAPRRRSETMLTVVPRVGADGGGIAAVGRF